MTIGELAQAASVPISTLRFYERRGLLPAPKRTRAGYRVFDEADAERVRFLKRAQELGFTLQELAMLLAMSKTLAKNPSRHDLARVGGEKIAEIDARIADMKRVRKAIVSLLDSPCFDPESPCPIVASLGRQRRA